MRTWSSWTLEFVDGRGGVDEDKREREREREREEAEVEVRESKGKKKKTTLFVVGKTGRLLTAC